LLGSQNKGHANIKGFTVLLAVRCSDVVSQLYGIVLENNFSLVLCYISAEIGRLCSFVALLPLKFHPVISP